MAIMAGEAITEGGTAGMRGASSARKARRRGEQLRSRRVTRRTPIESEIGGTQTETETYGSRQRSGGRRGPAGAYASQAAQVGRNARITPGRSSHQGAILAEFLVAVLIIVLAPIATGGSGGLSPYSANDLKRLVAIGAVYFGLALVPGDNGSKVAAWLGFLILVVLLMSTLNTTTSSGASPLKAVLDMFSQGGTAPPGATTPTG